MNLDIHELMDHADTEAYRRCAANDVENQKIRARVRAKIGAGRKPGLKNGVRLALAAAAAVAVLAGAALAANSLGLFEKALGGEAAKYAGNVNELSETARSENLAVTLDSVIYTEDKVYAIIKTDSAPSDIAASGRIVSAETREDSHWLTCAVTPVEGEENTWLITGKITYPFNMEEYLAGFPEADRAEQERLFEAAGDYASNNSLKNNFGDTLELTVTAAGEAVTLAAEVAKVSYEEISVTLDGAVFGADFFDTMLITPNEIVLEGVYTGLSAEELTAIEALAGKDILDPNYFWYAPSYDLTLVFKDGTEINDWRDSAQMLEIMNSGQILTEGFGGTEGYRFGGSSGGDPATGEFYCYLNPHPWTLDLSQLAEVRLNGVTAWTA